MDESPPKLLLDLFQAYYDARKNKRTTDSALRFELNYESHLLTLYEEIVSRRYEISPSTCFVVREPVLREIFAGDFRDRIVHHLLFNYLNPFCERLFINDSYACRTGKGTSYGIRRADHFIRSVSRNYTEPCFVLKLDISGYFLSIDHTILNEKVRAVIERFRSEATFDVDLVLSLLRQVIFHDHIAHCVVHGSRTDWNELPVSKSLFHAKAGCGLPIGNLTSQLFGNIYLNLFDHEVSRMIPGVRYGRYVDDMLLIHEDQDILRAAVPNIRNSLATHLRLTLHPKKISLQHYMKGVDFLGVSIRPGRIYLRHRLKGNIYRAILKWNIGVENGGYDAAQVAQFRSCLNSYLGNIARYRTRTLRKKLLAQLTPQVLQLVSFASPYRKVVTIEQPETL